MATAYAPGEHPDMKPPIGQTGLLLWLRKNLFSSTFNIVLTLVTLYFLYLVIPPLFKWLFVDSVFVAGSRNECRELGEGACWGFIGKRFAQFTYGFYPSELRWRVNLTFVLFIAALIPVLWDKFPMRRAGLWFSVLFPFIGIWLLLGGLPFDFVLTGLLSILGGIVGFFSTVLGWFGLDNLIAANDQVISGISKVSSGVDSASEKYGLEWVDTDRFGGFMLTLVIGVTGIVCSLPLGILLALGRQSNLHFIRWVCTGFIEFMRGVPLITLLFVASTMLNYFLPPGTTFDLLLRVLIMVTLFSAAYIAEVVRGGLQAIPKGQREAADAMGLKYWASMRLVVLPQALKISIPGIVNTFIGLFKDTVLVVIIGLLDPLGIGRASLSDIKWQGLSTEVYVFIAIFFFICCFSMSRYSIYLEDKLHTGHRND